MNNNVREFKRVIAITLCFCLIVLSNSSIQVNAKYNHRPYIKRFNQYFKTKKYKTSEEESAFAAFKKHETELFTVFKGESKKHTKKGLKSVLKEISRDFLKDNVSYLMLKKINKKELWVIEHNENKYAIGFIKANIKKCRVIMGVKLYNHKPKAKQMRKTKKWLRKMVNKVDNL